MDENTYYEAVLRARETQRKYDYFFLGVILASLSLSIQSYNPTSTTTHLYLLMSSWVLLLVSFLTGLYRQEQIVTFYRIEADLMPQERWKEIFDSFSASGELPRKPSGEAWTIDEVNDTLKRKSEVIDLGKNLMDKKAVEF